MKKVKNKNKNKQQTTKKPDKNTYQELFKNVHEVIHQIFSYLTSSAELQLTYVCLSKVCFLFIQYYIFPKEC